MSSLADLQKQLNNKEVIKQLSKSVNAKPSQVKKAAELGLPTLIEALNRNSNSQKGADDLNKALEKHQDKNVNNVTDFLKNVDTEDGSKILEHVLGNKSKSVQNGLAKKTGMDAGQIGGLLVQFAPLLMGLLGNKKKEEKLDSAGVSGLTSTLSGLFGGKKKAGGGGILDIAASFLDSDKDGDVFDDLGNLFGKK